MPLYEYHCNACGLEFEALVSFAEADSVACELCGSAKVERLASSFSSCCDSASGTGSGGAKPAKPACYTHG